MHYKMHFERINDDDDDDDDICSKWYRALITSMIGNYSSLLGLQC